MPSFGNKKECTAILMYCGPGSFPLEIPFNAN
jgi:hypothetical protein